MSRVRRFTVVLVLLSLAAASCGGADEEIGWVGDTVIHLSDIGALFEGDTLPMDDVFLDTLYRVMAVKPGYLEASWNKAKSVMVQTRKLDRMTTEIIAVTVSAVQGCEY